MPVVLQFCVVVMTLAVGSIALVMIRVMRRFEEAADEFKHTSEVARDLVADVGAVTRQVQEITLSLESVVPAFHRRAAP